ncbi:hypothetical protein GCM10009557_26260 [Virgisporangium ochraceum]|uniref:Uncharacterized protein n=1 Tax=Virgisporangium ochraceum TaxID=65505 RepID=A0A8J4A7T9_9ACTN|nr:hypothetical protein [Virgisporangium ochraceum]GIJ75480.1 hypothetical protein Voc01_103970 [Virgisporangium ochraceum]
MHLHGYDTVESLGPGRLSSRVVDGTPLLADPAFLAAEAAGVGPWTDEICAVFGVTPDDLRTLRRRHLTNPDALPVFTLPLATGGAVLIIHRVDPMSDHLHYRTDYWLAPATGTGMGLAEISGHGSRPGLRWPELREIARAGSPDRLVIAHRLLLLAPILGDDSAGDEAVDWFARAVEVVAGRDRRERAVRDAAFMIVFPNDPFDEGAWSCVDGVWVCHVSHSRRNPVGGDALRPDELRRCSEALAPGG